VISYTIDTSVFNPPPIPKDNSEKKVFPDQIYRYCKTITKCYELILKNEISVYVFRFLKNQFDDEYIRIAKKYNIPLPLESYKIKLDNIILYKIPEHHYGDKIGVKKYYFEDWFEECVKIKYLKCEQSEFNPSIQLTPDENNKIGNRLNLIGIINNFIYKDTKFLVLLIRESIKNISLESNDISFLFDEKEINEKTMSATINTKHIDNIKYSNEEQYESVLKVYKIAKEQFSSYIVFGNDVEGGIETIRDSAGPPDRIFAYLKTLTEYCEYKRKNGNTIPDDIILNALGCICSYESEKDMNDEKTKNARMFDNGNNEKILFNLHLKPNTFSEYEDLNKKSRTVRIYISWNEEQEKVIVGWIGRHLYLPPKSP
jgi:hypothetical protein